MNMRADPRLDPHNDPACRDVDPELFYPLPGRNDIADMAKAVCNRCPVKARCLAWAYESKQAHGILGGQTYKERKEARRHVLLETLRNERAGDTDALLNKFVHPPMPIAAWSEPEWAQ